MMGFLKDLFTRNWGLKLLSFLLAIVLWLTIGSEEKVFGERTIPVTLETRNIPSDMELVEKSISVVDVTVRAPNRLLGQLTAIDITAVLDLTRATPSQEEYALDPSLIIVPPSAMAVRVFPSKAHIKLERTGTAEMEVLPEIEGQVQPGFKVERVEALPAKIKVSGPESKFKARDKVRTRPVDVTGLAETAEFSTDVILPRAELRVPPGFAQIRIRVTIVPEKKTGGR